MVRNPPQNSQRFLSANCDCDAIGLIQINTSLIIPNRSCKLCAPKFSSSPKQIGIRFISKFVLYPALKGVPHAYRAYGSLHAKNISCT